MALGAQRGTVIWLVLRQVFMLAGSGSCDRCAHGAGHLEIRRIFSFRCETK
jgi:hypothetical protein